MKLAAVPSSPSAARAYSLAPCDRLYIAITGSDPSTAGELRRCDVKKKTCEIASPAGNPLQTPLYLIFRNSDPATLRYGPGE